MCIRDSLCRSQVEPVGKQASAREGRQLLQCHPYQPGTGGDGFRTSPAATDTQGTIGIDGKVADVRGIPVTADNEMTTADDPCTQAGADTQVDEILQSLACPKVDFTQGAQVGILLDPDWQVLLLDTALDLFDKIDFRPAKVDGVINLAGFRIHFAR